jgi:hypothetical protein
LDVNTVLSFILPTSSVKHEIKCDFKTKTIGGSLEIVASSIPDEKHKVNTLDSQMKDEKTIYIESSKPSKEDHSESLSMEDLNDEHDAMFAEKEN